MFDMQSVCEDCEKLNVSNQASEKQSRNLSMKVTGEEFDYIRKNTRIFADENETTRG